MIALPAKSLIRWRGWLIAAWTALAALAAPRAAHVQRLLGIQGTSTHPTEAAHASEVIRQAFPKPFAEYVAIVIHGPTSWTSEPFQAVLD